MFWRHQWRSLARAQTPMTKMRRSMPISNHVELPRLAPIAMHSCATGLVLQRGTPSGHWPRSRAELAAES